MVKSVQKKLEILWVFKWLATCKFADGSEGTFFESCFMIVTMTRLDFLLFQTLKLH